MTRADLVNLVIVLATSAGAVLLADAIRRLLVPLVVLEILAGILIGPQLLGLATATPLAEALARLGCASASFSQATRSRSSASAAPLCASACKAGFCR